MKINAVSTLLSIFLVVPLLLSGQKINPGEGDVYDDDEVAVIRLSMTDADKAFLLADDNIWSNTYLPATFSFINSKLDVTLNHQVGIRLRGNTSRGKPKRSFKIDFREFGGGKFEDLKKFNLKAEVNDPSLVREFFSLKSFRKANVPAARSHHIELYINDEYMGLYLNVEQIDDEFVQSRFDDDEGNLYKCSWGANLESHNDVYDDGLFELKTNEDINDRSILSNFIQVLNNTSTDLFESEIEKVFNVESFLRYLAVEALTGHWDGYSYNQNNFYLYENDDNGLIEFIPYDVDNTFGIDWVNRDWSDRDILDWPRHGEGRPLSKKILARPRYFNKYKVIIDELLNDDFSEVYFFEEFDEYKDRLHNSVQSDIYYPQSFGFTFQDFENSFDDGTIDHVKYGLKDYVSIRTSSARDQLGTILNIEEEPGLNVIRRHSSSGTTFEISGKVEDKILNIISMQGQKRTLDLLQNGPQDFVTQTNLKRGLYIIQIDGYIQKILVP